MQGEMRMDIRNSLDGLRSLLGVNPAVQPVPRGKSSAATQSEGAFDTDRATLSSMGNQAAQEASGEGIRTEKVAAVQAALASGRYSVPSSAVATKVVDSMLLGGR
jgi:flagellar biosynthesis anti-sigma factor FlgM